MLTTILGFVLLGFALSVPIGPITIEMVKRGVRGGFWHAWLVGLGGMMADIFFMLIVYLGFSTLFTGPLVQTVVGIFGSGVLIYLGLSSIQEASQLKKLNLLQEKNRHSPVNSFLTGFMMAVSNPMNLIFWIGIYGSVLASLEFAGSTMILFYSSFIILGILIWDVFLAGSVHIGKRLLGGKFLKGFSIVAGLVLIGFGISLGWRVAIQLTAIFQ